MSLVHQSDHVVLKDALIVLVAFIKIRLLQVAASVESEVIMSDTVKMHCAVISAVINTEFGDWMENRSSVSAAQTILGSVAIVSGQTVSAYLPFQCDAPDCIHFTCNDIVIVIWHGAQSITESDVTVATGQDQMN
eukprot:890170-Amphidinium_carterae.1